MCVYILVLLDSASFLDKTSKQEKLEKKYWTSAILEIFFVAKVTTKKLKKVHRTGNISKHRYDQALMSRISSNFWQTIQQYKESSQLGTVGDADNLLQKQRQELQDSKP